MAPNPTPHALRVGIANQRWPYGPARQPGCVFYIAGTSFRQGGVRVAILTSGCCSPLLLILGSSFKEWQTQFPFKKTEDQYSVFGFSFGTRKIPLAQQIYRALFNTNTDLFSNLITQLKTVDTPVSSYHYTALHVAAQNNCIEVVQLLLDRDASKTATCLKGRTPLHLALAANASDTGAFLLTAGADVRSLFWIFFN